MTDNAAPHHGLKQWWTIHGDELMRALREARDGGDPDLIYAELYANTDGEGGDY